MLALMCCYLMWGVTYLAQVHPLESELAARYTRHHSYTLCRTTEGFGEGDMIALEWLLSCGIRCVLVPCIATA